MSTAAALAAAGLLLGALAAAPPAACAADWTFGARSVHHDDALPLALGDAGDARRLRPRPGRNLAYVDDELRLARHWDGWSLALLARSYGTLAASEAALQLAAQVAAGERPADDRAWAVDLRLRAFSGAGLALGRAQALGGGWRGSAELQVLGLRRWHERRIDGGVHFTAASGQYAFELRSDELSSRLRFPYQDAYAGQGAALLASLALAWDGVAHWAEFGLRDGGWLHWRGLPRQQQRLDSATQAVDADGFLVYRPLIQGRDLQGGATRAWPWRARVAGGLRLAGGQRLGLEWESLPGFGVLPALRWQRPAPQGLAWSAEWRWHERRLGLAAAWRGLELRAGADRLGAGARSRELALAYRAAF